MEWGTLGDKIKKAAEDFKRREEELSRYFESDEFNSLIEIIQRHEKIDQESLLYGTQKIEGLTAENFGRVLEAVYHKLQQEMKEEELNSNKYFIYYKGIRFNLMIGQGSSYWTTKEKQ